MAICHANIIRCVNEHKDIDCLVSPANAFGMMTGGYDAALSNNPGCDFRNKVQWYIQDHFYGEQGVATSLLIETDLPGVQALLKSLYLATFEVSKKWTIPISMA